MSLQTGSEYRLLAADELSELSPARMGSYSRAQSACTNSSPLASGRARSSSEQAHLYGQRVSLLSEMASHAVGSLLSEGSPGGRPPGRRRVGSAYGGDEDREGADMERRATGLMHEDDAREHLRMRTVLAKATVRDRWLFACFDHILPLSIALQLLCMLLMHLLIGWNNVQAEDRPAGATPLCTAFQALQLVLMLGAYGGLSYEVRMLFVRPSKIMFMFLSQIVCFGGLYAACEIYDGTALHDSKDPEDVQTTLHLWLDTLYFSIVNITSCGFGDIHPSTPLAIVVVCVQDLLGVLFNLGVFTLALNHFRVFNSILTSAKHVHRRPGRARRLIKWIRSFWVFEKLRKAVVKYLLLVMLLLQGASVALMLLTEGQAFDLQNEQPLSSRASLLGLGMCLLQLVILYGTSYRLVRKAGNKEITLSFLMQAYVAAASTFANVYMVVYLLGSGDAFSNVHSKQACDGTDDVSCGWHMALHLFYFSINVQTGTGLGDIVAVTSASRAIVIVQLLMAVYFNVYIFGLGISHLVQLMERRSKASIATLELETLLAAEPEAAEHKGVGVE